MSITEENWKRILANTLAVPANDEGKMPGRAGWVIQIRPDFFFGTG